MQRKKKLRPVLAVLLLLAIATANPQNAAADVVSDGEGIIIYLDAGHDGTHAGSYKKSLHEETLNLKIAKYCKEKLEEYEGVTVYMSREDSKCPHPGTNSVDDNIARVEDAVKKNATLYVALHNNASPASYARGAMAYYPNTSYNKEVSDIGKAAAGEILKRLEKLGLRNRGVSIRNSEDGTRYPDNSRADYYNIIKTAKLNGLPAIIVEHAFLTNSSDAGSFLDSDEKLKKLGEADAKGIAGYYGLKKKKTTRPNLKKVVQTDEDTVKLTWSALDGADYYIILRRELISPAKGKKDAVYSEWEKIGKTKKERYSDHDFASGKTYCYTVKAHLTETDSFSKKHPAGFTVTTK